MSTNDANDSLQQSRKPIRVSQRQIANAAKAVVALLHSAADWLPVIGGYNSTPGAPPSCSTQTRSSDTQRGLQKLTSPSPQRDFSQGILKVLLVITHVWRWSDVSIPLAVELVTPSPQTHIPPTNKKKPPQSSWHPRQLWTHVPTPTQARLSGSSHMATASALPSPCGRSHAPTCFITRIIISKSDTYCTCMAAIWYFWDASPMNAPLLV